MRMMLVVAVALLGCRGGAQSSQTGSGSGSGSGGSGGPGDQRAANAGSQGSAMGSDRAASADSNPLPTAVERKRISDEVCPAVTAPYFYKVEKAGKVSHLLGTRHSGVSLGKFPKAVHDALVGAKLLVLEATPGERPTSPPKAVSMPDTLGPELWKRYKALVGDEAAAQVETAPPFAAMLMAVEMYEDNSKLERELIRAARGANVPMQGLASVDFQLELIQKVVDARFVRAVLTHVEDRKEIETELRKDLAEYCNGSKEDPTMDAQLRKDLTDEGYTKDELDAMEEQMTFSRNADWIPKLEPLLDAGGAFVAVGASHLMGPRGVPALLTKRGYKVTRIK